MNILSSLILDFSVNLKCKWVFRSSWISNLSCDLNIEALLLDQVWSHHGMVLHSLDEGVDLWICFNNLEVFNFILEGTTSETDGSLKHDDNAHVDHHWVFVLVHEAVWSFVFGDELFSFDEKIFVCFFSFGGVKVVNVGSVEAHDGVFVEFLHKKSVSTGFHVGSEVTLSFSLMWPEWKTLTLWSKSRSHLHQNT